MGRTSKLRYRIWSMWLVIVLTLPAVSVSHAANVTQQQYSDAQLLDMGLKAYEMGRRRSNRDALAEALGWLVAYVQRNTRPFMEDRNFANSLLTAIHQTRRHLSTSSAGAGAKGDDPGGPRQQVRLSSIKDRTTRERSGQGNRTRDHRQNTVVPAHRRTDALICRGGGKMRFEFRVGGYGLSGPGVVTNFRWTSAPKFRRGGVGDYWGKLRPGTCAWKSRAVGRDDPTSVCRTKIKKSDSLVWTIGGRTELRRMPSYLRALQSTGNFVTFDVYDNRKNCLVAAKVMVLRPSSNRAR